MQYHNQNMKSFSLFAKALVIAMCALLLSCAQTPWKEPREASDPLERNIEEIEALIKETPESTRLRQELYLTKEKVTNQLMLLAEQAKLDGNLLEAEVYYERILAYDPKNSTAISAIERLALANKSNEAVNKANQLKSSNQLQLAKKLVHDTLLESGVRGFVTRNWNQLYFRQRY